VELDSLTSEEAIEVYFDAVTQNNEKITKALYPEDSLFGNINDEDSSDFNKDIYNLKIKYEPEYSEERKPDEVYNVTFEVDNENLLYHRLEENYLIYDCNTTDIGILVELFFHLRYSDTEKHYIIKSIGTGP
jgi:hypothetical protein